MTSEVEQLQEKKYSGAAIQTEVPYFPDAKGTLFEIYNIHWFEERGVLHMRIRPVGDKTSTVEFECTLLHMENVDGKRLLLLEQSHKFPSRVLLEVSENSYLKQIDETTLSKVAKQFERAIAENDEKTLGLKYRPKIEEVFGLKYDPSGWFEVTHNPDKKPHLKVQKLKALFKRPRDESNDDY